MAVLTQYRIIASLAVLCALFLIYQSLLGPLTIPTSVNLSTSIKFHAPWSFGSKDGAGSPRASRPTVDIVVSMFKENATQLAMSLEQLRDLDQIKANADEVVPWIYVKDVEANVEELQQILNTTNVFIVPNRGREAGAFLGHVISNWDNLARHTVFMQAEMHFFENAKHKIIDYFIPETGFLSLGYFETCQCVNCHDSWDGEREFPRLEELYAAINGQLCPKDIVLGYLGQVMVSQRRIQSRTLDIYTHLKSVLESDLDHHIHEDPRQKDQFHDVPENPYFGHTMERAWHVLWGCEDVSLFQKCGGLNALFSRRGPEDADDKCQCLD